MNRQVVYVVIMAVLAFAIVVLWLNLRENDRYFHALDAPPAGPINEPPPGWLGPQADTITESLRWMRVEDVDGWYRLFWAGTDIYYFDDPAYFVDALTNRTARNPSGRWTIKGEAGGRPFAIAYALRQGPPPDGEVEVGPLRVPAGLSGFTSRQTFSWVLEK